MAELLVCLDAGLTFSKDAGLLGRLNKIRAEVLCSSRNGEGFYLAWKPRCLGPPRNLALKKPETCNLSPRVT